MKQGSKQRPRPKTKTSRAKTSNTKTSRAKAPKTTMSKMTSYPTFDAWLDAQSAPHAKIVAPLRKLAARVSKKLVETVKWGNACWELDGLPITFVHAEREHVQLGFFAGALLDDPRRALTGSGKYVRSQKLFSPGDIDQKYLSRLFTQALTIEYR